MTNLQIYSLGLVLFSIAAALGLRHSRWGLYLSLFLAPYDAGPVLVNAVKLNVVFVCGYAAGYLSPLIGRRAIWSHTPNRRLLAAIGVLTLVSLVASLWSGKHAALTMMNFEPIMLLNSLLRYFSSLAAAMLLYVVLCRELDSLRSALHCILAYVLSCGYLVVTYVGSFLLKRDLSTFLRTRYSGNGSRYEQTYNFAGYTGESGLTAEYCLILVCLSLIILNARKGTLFSVIAMAAMAAAAMMLISTTSRAGLLGLGLLTCLMIGTLLLRGKISLLPTAGVVACAAAGVFMILPLIQSDMDVTVQEKLLRLQDSLKGTSSMRHAAEVDAVINRPYARDWANIVEESGLLGVGPFLALGMHGSELISHSLYAGLVARVGIIGLALYTLFYLSILWTLGKVSFGREARERTVPAMLFWLMLVLFLNQAFHNYENWGGFMLTFWFLFALGASAKRWTAAPSEQDAPGELRARAMVGELSESRWRTCS